MALRTSRLSSTLFIFFLAFGLLVLPANLLAFEKVITIPAENSKGIVLDLEQGSYMVTYEGGAIALFYPINPHYSWIVGAAIGTGNSGGQDEPDIGTIYYQPRPAVFSQYQAEELALEAAEGGHQGTYIHFTLAEGSEVRFWVSDFDYTDNAGMIKLKIQSLQ
jgi:hypothetical protein